MLNYVPTIAFRDEDAIIIIIIMFHCFDHEIVLEDMQEEISQQRCTIGAHWYTNNLPENRASKTNVDVVDKKVNSETKLSTREGCVPLDILSFVQKVRK